MEKLFARRVGCRCHVARDDTHPKSRPVPSGPRACADHARHVLELAERRCVDPAGIPGTVIPFMSGLSLNNLEIAS